MGANAGRWRLGARRARRAGLPVLVVVALVGGCASPVPTQTPSITTSSPRPSTSPVTPPSAIVSPSPAATQWEPIGGEQTTAAVATLAPRTIANGLIGPGTEFDLTALTGEPAATLASRLVVDPVTVLVQEAGPDAAHVRIRPATPFPEGVVVHFRLSDAAGALTTSWAYQVDRAPRVVGTLPGDGATGVPTNTGVEATFDQDGVVVGTGDVVISPRVPGRVQLNGRTVAFVPNTLSPGTLYTVTIRKGVRRPGSTFSLSKDVTWRFQTARTATAATGSAQLVGQLVAGLPSEPALLPVSVEAPEGSTPVAAATVIVSRLPTRASAISAVRTLAGRPTWAQAERLPLVPADGLPVILRARLRIEPLRDSWASAVRLPRALPGGWYLISFTVNGYVSQAVLQVTDLAPFATITDTRTLVWINDASRHGPVARCRIALNPGVALGSTNAAGILDAATPATLTKAAEATSLKDVPALIPAGTVILIDAADGRRAFTVPGGGILAGLAVDASGSAGSAGDDWWHALTTDRVQYRSTDTVNAWGYVRGRTRLDVPSTIDLVISADVGGPSIASDTVAPNATGAFVATLPLRDLPAGTYQIELRAGGVTIDSTSLTITTIRKPLYRLALEFDRNAAMAGEALGTTIKASFYDGSPAAGVAVVSADKSASLTLTTAADGLAHASVVAQGQARQAGAFPDEMDLGVRAAAPEEGDISASAGVLVFSSSLLVDATASLRARSLTVDGAVHQTDIAHLNRLADLAAAQAADPRGPAVGRQVLAVQVTEHWWVTRRTGTAYDPITKRTSPVYDSTEKVRVLPKARATTGSDGRFHVTVRVPNASHWYTVTVSTQDPAGREAVAETEGMAPAQAGYPRPPLLAFASTPSEACPAGCRVGEEYQVSLVGAGALPTDGSNRYLYLVEQRGLQRWAISRKPSRAETFNMADAPTVYVDAVWFTGTGYVKAEGTFSASLAAETRTLHVAVTPDEAAYSPGGTATVRVAVTDPGGRPVAGASLVAAVVDEKLFDVSGGPPISDPMQMLYGWVPAGILAMSGFPSPVLTTANGGNGCGQASAMIAQSSAVPITAATCGGGGFGGGSTTGGGGGEGARADFQDALLFRSFTTDAAGLATISIPLADDITTWRVAVAAMDGRLQGGVGTAGLPVGLPFFADLTVAPQYLAGDRPIVIARAFGSTVRPDTTVRFTVSSDTLPMAGVTVTGPASNGVGVPLPPLTLGTHHLTVTADDGTHRDTLMRTFSVVVTRRTSSVLTSWDLTATLRPEGGTAGFSTYVIGDVGRGQWVPALLQMAANPATRSDQQAAAIGARDLLASVFHLGDDALPPVTGTMDPYRTTDGGLAIVEYGSADLEMTVRTLLANPGIATPVAATWLHAIADEATETPERQTVALVGLAAIGEPVLTSLQGRAAASDLSVRDALWLGLGLAALGDDGGAATLETRIANAAGQRRGVEIRIAVDGGADAVAAATARFAQLAAAIGDPRAQAALGYVASHPSRTDLAVDEELATIRALVAHEPPARAVVAWTVNGTRTVTDLSDGRAASLVLTPAQRATVTLEAVAGHLTVVGRWTREGASATPPASTLGLVRKVTPAGTIGRTQIVRVQLRPSFAVDSLPGEYQVDETVPSGLVPLDSLAGWAAPDGATATPCSWPVSVDGQLLRFATSAPQRASGPPLCYLARVVTPGAYAWEPATMWSVEAPEDWVGSAVDTVTIN